MTETVTEPQREGRDWLPWVILALLAIVLVALVLLNRDSGGYDVRILTVNAGQVVKDNEVRIGGAAVGTVSRIRLTDQGVSWAEEHTDELAAVWAPFAPTEQQPVEQPSGQADIKSEIGQVVSAVWQLATQGSEQQRRAALDVLVDTRRRLYGILADGRDGDGRDQR